MSDERGEELDQWLQDEVAPAAARLGGTVMFGLSRDTVRQHFDDMKAATGDDKIAAAKHVADVLRTTQATKVAPEKWRGRVLEVVTESGSRYVIDTVEWTLHRVRGRDEQDDPEVAPASRLRRDGDALRLLRVIRLEVGSRAVFDVEPLRPDAVWTRRTTTFVLEIRDSDSGLTPN